MTPPNLLAFLGSAFGLVVAEEELPVEELDADHGEDEQEEDVDDEDVEDILEGDHDAVKDSLEGGHPVDHLERTQHSKKLHRLQLRSSRRSPEKSDRVRSNLFAFRSLISEYIILKGPFFQIIGCLIS